MHAPLKVTVNSHKNLHCQSLNSKFTEVNCLPFDKRNAIPSFSFYLIALYGGYGLPDRSEKHPTLTERALAGPIQRDLFSISL